MTQEPDTILPPRSSLLVQLVVDAVFLLLLGLPCVGASAALRLLLGLLGSLSWSPGQWLSIAPLLYVAWLFLLITTFALISSLLGTFYTKPKRLVWPAGAVPPLQMLICVYQYWVGALIYHLPVVRLLLCLSTPKWLIFRACATRCRVSLEGTSILGVLQDPDLVQIGPSVLVGDRSCLVAHSFTVNESGSNVFSTAPIIIEAGASIGGDVLIEPGVVIGTGAMVEPFSRVSPFTRIPAGEIWGGVPAIFLRRRDGDSRAGKVCSARDVPQDVLNLIAAALGEPRDAITPESGAKNVESWDSLGRMAIAAALESSLGVRLPVERIFALDSVASVLDQLKVASSAADAGLPSVALIEELPRDPELLPLLPLPQATALLLASPPPSSNTEPIKVVIAATFVAEPLEPSLRLWSQAFGLALNVQFAGFNQVAPTLLDPDGPFRSSLGGVNLVLCRPEDLCTNLEPDGYETAGAILSAIEAYSGSGGALLVGDLPPVVSRRFEGNPAAIATLQRSWLERLNGIAGVRPFPFSDLITQLGVDRAGDPALEERASTPYSTAFYQLLGAEIARELHRRHVPAKKLLALDGDNTLWGGVLGEDGPEGVTMRGGFAALQQRLRRLKEQGVLLTLVSKNEESDLLSLLHTHPEAILKPDDFVAHRIGWTDKAESLRALARELNLGLDSFVFIDDNPVERAAVEARCPEVMVLPLPEDPAEYGAQLDRLWCFDSIGTSEEDRSRTSMLEEERRRKLIQGRSTDLATYLQGLELKVNLRRATPADHARVAQLTQRTNQFNLSCRRRNHDEVARLATTEATLWVASAADRFGDYGLVGVVIMAPAAPGAPPMLDTFLLSCRALGRGVEEAILYGICRDLWERGQAKLVAPYVVTTRNTPVLEFFRRQQWEEEGPDAFSRSLKTLPELPAHVTLRVVN